MLEGLQIFREKEELRQAYARTLASKQCLRAGHNRFDDELETALITADQMLVYNPTVYRGGWHISGYGKSTERAVHLLNKIETSADTADFMLRYNPDSMQEIGEALWSWFPHLHEQAHMQIAEVLHAPKKNRDPGLKHYFWLDGIAHRP